MANNRGYDVVVDVDDHEGDLGHTDLQEDLEFHSSSTALNPLQKPLLLRLLTLIDFNEPTSKFPSSAAHTNFHPPSSSPPNSKRYLWTLSFYAQFFDVDTTAVLSRCLHALLPFPNPLIRSSHQSFLDILDGNPDLYGPFWIATTVVFILFLTGTISHYLASHHDKAFIYNFRLLSGAAGLVYGYTAFVPVGLWGALKWFNRSSSATLGEATSGSINLIECYALYGYSNAIWIPVALISWSPIQILNYVFVAVGFAVSVVFLTRNLWPVVSGSEAKVSRGLLIAVVGLHAGLAIAIKFLFFAASPAAKNNRGDEAEKGEKMVRALLGM